MTSNWGFIYDVDIIDGIKLCEMVWSQLDYNFFCLFWGNFNEKGALCVILFNYYVFSDIFGFFVFLP